MPIVQYFCVFIIYFRHCIKMKYKNTDRQICKRLWSKEEDQILVNITTYNQQEPMWPKIANNFNCEMKKLKHPQTYVERTNKQCRERWQNNINPTLNNNAPWTGQEHKAIFSLFAIHNHHWSKISQGLQSLNISNRGDNSVKNYFYSSIRKALRKINQIIQNRNTQNRRIKNQVYSCNEKYAYRQRLSLQRQIMKQKEVLKNETEQAVKNEDQQHCYLNNKQQSIERKQLRILKEIDPSMITKLFQIADSKNIQKLTSNYKNYQKSAQIIKITFIEYTDNDSEFNDERILEIVRNIHEINKNCKRKAVKICEVQGDQIKGSNYIAKKKQIIKRDKQKIYSSQKQRKKRQLTNMQKSEISQFHQKRILQTILIQQNNVIPQTSIGWIEIQRHTERKPLSFNSIMLQQGVPFINAFLNNVENLNIISLQKSNEYRQNIYKKMPFYSAFDCFNPIPIAQERYVDMNDNRSNKFNNFNDNRQYTTISPFVRDPHELFINETSNNQKQKKQESQQLSQNKNVNVHEFGFINSIKEIQQPNKMQGLFQQQALADFQMPCQFSSSMNTHFQMNNTNLYKNEMNLVDSFNFRNQGEQRLASSSLQQNMFQRQFRSRISSNSRSKTIKSKEKQGEGFFPMDNSMFRSKEFMSRSCAYSEHPADNRNILFTSNNYEYNKIQQFAANLKVSNFLMFQPK